MNDKQDNMKWLHAKLEEAGLTEQVARDAMTVLYGSWDARRALAWEYGHNVARLTGHDLIHFANAYADACEEEIQGAGSFWASWINGDYQPDVMGRYHRGPWTAAGIGTDG